MAHPEDGRHWRYKELVELGGGDGEGGPNHVPDPTEEPDDRILKTESGLLVYADIPSGGGGGGSDWDTEVVATEDESVVNSATMQSHTELTVAVTANSFYVVEFFLILARTAISTILKYHFAFPAISSNGRGNGYWNGLNSSGMSTLFTSFGTTTKWPFDDVQASSSSADPYIHQGRFTLVTGTEAGPLVLKHANQNSGSDGRTAIVKAASRLRIKKLA